MIRRVQVICWMATAFAAVSFSSSAWAQRSVPPRRFAPGVVITIPPAVEADEMISGPVPLVEPLAIPGLEYDPKLAPKSETIFERAKAVTLRRTVWNLEFSFKPMRMIYVDIPQASGRMQRKLVWYMVYRVRNLGDHARPTEMVEELKSPGGGTIRANVTYAKELTGKEDLDMFGQNAAGSQNDRRFRFFPHFVLASSEYNKEYLDRVIPAALEPVKAREFPGRPEQKLYDSLSISTPLAISDEQAQEDHSLWGVVTWTDIDPRIDYFMVYVQGLSNAYRFEDPAGGYKAGDAPGTGRVIKRKTLQLNFWRPGDTVDPNEQELRFGCRIDPDPAEQEKVLKQYGIERPVDNVWIYR